MTRFFLVFCLTALSLASAGCAASSDCTVRGRVTFNDEPVKEGDILFIPEAGNARPSAGKVIDGEFDCDVPVGRHKVEIRASRPMPGVTVAGMGNVYEDYVPSRYNSATELHAEVRSGAENRFDFALVGEKTPRPRR